jgi:peptidoglycan/LPS O-acetylase OafA/YrhL
LNNNLSITQLIYILSSLVYMDPSSTSVISVVALPVLDHRPTQPGEAVAPRKAYLVGLNSLRGLAALMVCLYHFTNGALPKAIVPTTKWLFAHGNLGVEIFFVISGFIIPYSLVGKNHQVKGFFSYLKKRIIRINPPAYAALLLTVGQAFFIDNVIQHRVNYTKDITWMRVLHNVLFTVPFSHYTWLLGVLWTLAIEFQFYLFIGLLFSTLFERKSVWWFAGAYLVLAGIQQFWPVADSFLQYSSLFALGGVALLWQQQRLSKVAYGGLLAVFTVILYWQIDVYVAVAGLATALALNALRMKVPVLDFLGKISYSFYLLHLLLGTSCEFLLIKFIAPVTVSSKLLIVSIAIGTAVVGSYIFYRLVEQPCMRLASRLR